MKWCCYLELTVASVLPGSSEQDKENFAVSFIRICARVCVAMKLFPTHLKLTPTYSMFFFSIGYWLHPHHCPPYWIHDTHGRSTRQDAPAGVRHGRWRQHGYQSYAGELHWYTEVLCYEKYAQGRMKKTSLRLQLSENCVRRSLYDRTPLPYRKRGGNSSQKNISS